MFFKNLNLVDIYNLYIYSINSFLKDYSYKKQLYLIASLCNKLMFILLI